MAEMPTGEALSFEAGKGQFQAFAEMAAEAATAAERMGAYLQQGGLRDTETLGDLVDIMEKAMALKAAADTALDNFVKNHQNLADAVLNAPVEAAETEFYQPTGA